ncbi:DJ-1 family glyoxalase III [Beggiatoa leptomitoformis]|uniref:DJ-1 family protein n=1 Tax=Beggiatoa leptomitoformis TaxID=288004 RepID=A0A2N9YHM6_9GAMM|nr:DJ-1 family glyoxalase III [Beggiatoa leptomitoformis]ALG67728.1 DJ-1 family protein [Beggiatoa leptomitoformis]AUI70032.1 DJ-1 family protein [Beggiatoa leptomitoformis]
MSTVLVPLAQGCEELEAVTIIDLLRRANITVITAGLDEKPVKASRGVVLIPDTTIDQVLPETFDMIVLPGGAAGAENLNRDPRIHQLLKTLFYQGKYVAAICAAPIVLATAALLDNKQATCYPNSLKISHFPTIQLLDSPVVIDGKVITSRGPGTAMDFALILIEKLAGKPIREQVESGLMRPH